MMCVANTDVEAVRVRGPQGRTEGSFMKGRVLNEENHI